MVIQEAEPVLIAIFQLGQALFGIETANMQEVITSGSLTPVHHAPVYIRGITNLRGQIVTIIDLAQRLGMEQPADRPEGHILIVHWHGENIGLLVDQVSDVLETNLEDLSPAPANMSLEQQRYLKGVQEIGGHLVGILDTQLLLDEE
jgi:purine-binding chemotaxis protein CheW